MTSEGSERIPGFGPGPELEHKPASADTPQYADAGVPSPGRPSLADDGSARQGTGFDPTPYLRQLHGRGRGGGADYLDVKWRLLWLRKEHPDAEIVTELVQHDPQMAIFKATVTVPTGGKATGYGSETASDFPDFIEKAETKAIGRALNALGYGAQFGDFQRSEDPAPDSAPAQPGRQATPVARPVALPRRDVRSENPRQTTNETPGEAPAAPSSPGVADQELIDYSWSAFWPWARERGLNGPREIENLIGQQVAGLSPAELRDLILAADSRR
ncbi:MAG TPA: hypothetical protein VHG52_01130 [Thermomicrobiales bacterium]|nr:hypothetical protein [Thermomicrobiales bacterium]